jgi:hypothetical protein
MGGGTLGALDHYRCYGATSGSVTVPLDLDDVLAPAESVTTTEASLLCVPASIDGSIVMDSLDALLCYDLDTGPTVPAPITVDNLFGTGSLMTFAMPDPEDVDFVGVCLPTRIAPPGCIDKSRGGCNGCVCEPPAPDVPAACALDGNVPGGTGWAPECVDACEELQDCVITPLQ